MDVDDEQLERILRAAERVAVVGWSTNPDRDSHRIAAYLDEQGYQVLPVNPNYAGETVFGTEVVGSLTELEDVDIVDVFRRSQDVPEHLEPALELHAPVFWMQLGIRNQEVADQLEAAGIEVVQDRCMLVEHRRFL